MKRTIAKLMAALVIGIGMIGGASAAEAQEKEWVKISDMPDKYGVFHKDMHSLCKGGEGPYGTYANEYSVYDNITARCKLEQPAFPHNYPAAITCHNYPEGSFSWDRPDGCYVFKVPEPEECPEGLSRLRDGKCESEVEENDPMCDGMDGGDTGGVVCKGGKWEACVWNDFSYMDNQEARDIATICIRNHEKIHIKDPNKKCNEFDRLDFSEEFGPQAEMDAYEAEIKCYDIEKPRCKGDRECLDHIEWLKKDAQDNYDFYKDY